MVITVMLFAIGFSAFRVESETNTKDVQLTEEWFELIPQGNPNDANDYMPVAGQPCDGNSSNICGVFVIEDTQNPGHPDLTASPVYVYKDL